MDVLRGVIDSFFVIFVEGVLLHDHLRLFVLVCDVNLAQFLGVRCVAIFYQGRLAEVIATASELRRLEEGGLRLLPCPLSVALGALATFWLEIFDEVYAVDLALPVDHVVALELVNGAELLEGFELIDAHL